jgi:hypothetical protein
MQVPYNFQQVINNNQYQVISGVKCFPVSMLDENFNYLCKVVNVGSTAPTISYDGQFWFDGTTLKIAQSSSWVDIKVANAVNADKLSGILPSQFLRADQDTTCSGKITAQQFVSQTTSSSPLVVSSNQLVTNLCADYLDGYHLDSTNAVTGQLVQFDTANIELKPVPIYYNSSNGYVGIGTTTPQATLHVRSSGATIVQVDAPSSQQCGYRWLKDGAVKWSAYIDANSNDLRFWDGIANRVTFANGGNVGIGILPPSHKLHVAGNIAIQAGANAFIGTVDNYNLSIRTNGTDRIVIGNNGNIAIGTTTVSSTAILNIVGDYIKISSPNTDRPRIQIYAPTSTSEASSGIDFLVDSTQYGGVYINGYTKDINFFQTVVNTLVKVLIMPYHSIVGEGQLSVIIPDPLHGAYKADFPSGWYGGVGIQNLTCVGIYYDILQQRSDASMKTDVQPLPDYLNTDCLDIISCLKPIKYVYVDDPLKINRFGFIAQDVSEVCPELVTIDTEGKASLNYMDLIALLTKGIQELYEMLGKVVQKIGGIE